MYTVTSTHLYKYIRAPIQMLAELKWFDIPPLFGCVSDTPYEKFINAE